MYTQQKHCDSPAGVVNEGSEGIDADSNGSEFTIADSVVVARKSR